MRQDRSKVEESDRRLVEGILKHTHPVGSAACVCGEINTRHCPVHGNLEPTHDWFSVQAGFWRTLWLVLRGGRLREWKNLPVGSIEDLLDEDDYAVMRIEEELGER